MKKIYLIFTSLCLTFLAVSCAPETGCTDYDADNYDSYAEEDDGSCSYSTQFVFYLPSSKGTYFYGLGVYGLYLYVDGTCIGGLNTGTQALSSVPNCETYSDVLRWTVYFDNASSSNSIHFVGNDQSGNTIYDQYFSNLNYTGSGLCNMIDL